MQGRALAERDEVGHGEALDPEAWFREFQRTNDATNARLDRMDEKEAWATRPVSVVVREERGRTVRRLVRGLVYDEKTEAPGCRFALRLELDAGTESELASTPRLLWWLIAPDGLHERAAWLHDQAYRWNIYSREFCDALFLGIMRADGVPTWRRWAMWAAVRLFGGPGYRRAGRLAQKD